MRVVTKTLVSVVLPTYNRAPFLREAIESVLAQTYRELELVVVDDGSTDATSELVAELQARDDRIRCEYQPNAGVSAARNRGMRLARGELVAFIDSDDAWKPWKLELQVRCLKLAPEAGMLWTDMQAVGGAGDELSPAFLTRYYRAYRYFSADTLFARRIPLRAAGVLVDGAPADRSLYVGDVFSAMLMGNLVHTPTAIVRRERLAAVDGFSEAFRHGGEDFDFWIRLCRDGPVGFVDVSSIRYRTGLADNLANPVNGVHMATSYLAAIEPVLRSDRERDRAAEPDDRCGSQPRPPVDRALAAGVRLARGGASARPAGAAAAPVSPAGARAAGAHPGAHERRSASDARAAIGRGARARRARTSSPHDAVAGRGRRRRTLNVRPPAVWSPGPWGAVAAGAGRRG